MLNHPNQNLTIRHESNSIVSNQSHHPPHPQSGPGGHGQQLNSDNINNSNNPPPPPTMTAPKKRMSSEQNRNVQGTPHHQLNAQQVNRSAHYIHRT